MHLSIWRFKHHGGDLMVRWQLKLGYPKFNNPSKSLKQKKVKSHYQYTSPHKTRTQIKFGASFLDHFSYKFTKLIHQSLLLYFFFKTRHEIYVIQIFTFFTNATRTTQLITRSKPLATDKISLLGHRQKSLGLKYQSLLFLLYFIFKSHETYV